MQTFEAAAEMARLAGHSRHLRARLVRLVPLLLWPRSSAEYRAAHAEAVALALEIGLDRKPRTKPRVHPTLTPRPKPSSE